MPYVYDVHVEPRLRNKEDQMALKSCIGRMKRHRSGYFAMAPDNTIGFLFRGSRVTVKRSECVQPEQQKKISRN